MNHTALADVRDRLAALDCPLVFEAGEELVADACVLVARVIYVDETDGKRLAVVDAHLDALSGREILAVRDTSNAPRQSISLVGARGEAMTASSCEASLPHLMAGDLVAIMNVGAFGHRAFLASDDHLSAPETLVSGAQVAVIRRRIATAEKMLWESFPEWMEAGDAA